LVDPRGNGDGNQMENKKGNSIVLADYHEPIEYLRSGDVEVDNREAVLTVKDRKSAHQENRWVS
jgi:hypothetical protein